MKDLTEYKAKFDRENYRHYHLKISNKQKEVIKHLEKQENKNGYIIELIRKDMERK